MKIERMHSSTWEIYEQVLTRREERRLRRQMRWPRPERRRDRWKAAEKADVSAHLYTQYTEYRCKDSHTKTFTIICIKFHHCTWTTTCTCCSCTIWSSCLLLRRTSSVSVSKEEGEIRGDEYAGPSEKEISLPNCVGVATGQSCQICLRSSCSLWLSIHCAISIEFHNCIIAYMLLLPPLTMAGLLFEVIVEGRCKTGL